MAATIFKKVAPRHIKQLSWQVCRPRPTTLSWRDRHVVGPLRSIRTWPVHVACSHCCLDTCCCEQHTAPAWDVDPVYVACSRCYPDP